MNTAALVMGFVLCIGIGQSLLTGSAAANNKGLLREADPLLYWGAVGAAGVAACVMFYFAWKG